MKNQYFGDVRDWTKYAILSALRDAGFRTTTGWMLTPDDGRSDGELRGYLDFDNNRLFDPQLFDWLRRWRGDGAVRDVRLIEASGLLEGCHFFRDQILDTTVQREQFFTRLGEAAADSDLVFLDPDNGLEVPSRKRGAAGSSKYVYWTDVSRLFDRGHSLLVYQHLARVNRAVFVQRRLEELFERVRVSRCFLIKTMGVYYFVIPHREHEERLRQSFLALGGRWDLRIDWDEFDAAGVVERGARLEQDRSATTPISGGLTTQIGAMGGVTALSLLLSIETRCLPHSSIYTG